jgi:hypothetical protein
MKKRIKFLLLLLTLGLLGTSCTDSGGVEESRDFVMKAAVTGIGERIEVNVFRAEYAEGIYWLVTDDGTLICDNAGNKISLADIKEGDNVEIRYNGQVMMSYPPQVYAISIKKI